MLSEEMCRSAWSKVLTYRDMMDLWDKYVSSTPDKTDHHAIIAGFALPVEWSGVPWKPESKSVSIRSYVASGLAYLFANKLDEKIEMFWQVLHEYS